MDKTASALGMPFRCIQNNGGAQIMAINTDRRKGTRIEPAARIPATRITKLAPVIKMRLALDVPPFCSIRFPPRGSTLIFIFQLPENESPYENGAECPDLWSGMNA
jgi:hypothetical protein